ncbi:MAG: hypothetical protein JNM90_02855 [Burkholderiales bacterium]|nr:hypothetical protein [Burkholderiales bacterium]
MAAPTGTRIAIARSRARRLGLAAVAAALALEAASALVCRDADTANLLLSLAFLLIPLAPALVALATPNPLCAVAGAATVAGWIAYASQVECGAAAQTATAATVYYAVWFYGFLSAAAATLLAAPLLRVLGIRVAVPARPLAGRDGP